MSKPFMIALALLAGFGGSAVAADFDAATTHAGFINAFNNRQWGDLRPLLADDIVFHRANANQVYSGSIQVLKNPDHGVGGRVERQVRRAELHGSVTGKDGRVVERGNFAVTAGPKDDDCYAGSYMMTWAPEPDNKWQLKTIGLAGRRDRPLELQVTSRSDPSHQS